MSGGENVRPVRAELALLDLYDEALPQVYGYLLARCGRVSLAEELTAETLLAAVTACRRVPPPVPSTAWLVGIARHKLVDHWRAAEREHRGWRRSRRSRAPTTTRGRTASTRSSPATCSPSSTACTGPR